MEKKVTRHAKIEQSYKKTTKREWRVRGEERIKREGRVRQQRRNEGKKRAREKREYMMMQKRKFKSIYHNFIQFALEKENSYN